ncbi:MAG: N-acetylmuramoyl-L-alanine amidase [Desulfuromonadales bacterium]|nr:N-acetylmuramoyl-L-alanine amidase [Desulfuromonadales bacterium]
MSRCLLLIVLLPLLLLCSTPALALVEIGLLGKEPLLIEEVYQREGTSFVGIDEVLTALELDGDWDSVQHIYRIRTVFGTATISPGSQFVKIGDSITPIAHRPRFIDGRLRVSEAFVRRQLAPLLTTPLHYLNHDPPQVSGGDDLLDRFFSFLLRRKAPGSELGQRVVVIDPGHGGQDPGAIGLHGSKEKDVNLDIGQRLEKLLKMHQDAPVVLTRNDDYALDRQRRLEIVAEAAADALISLHTQSLFSREASGIMLFVQPQFEEGGIEEMFDPASSLRLATALHETLGAAGFPVHEIRQQTILPLGRGDLPRVLVEMGNLNNADDLAILQDPTRQQDLARALFDGLQNYFRAQQESAHEPKSRSSQ